MQWLRKITTASVLTCAVLGSGLYAISASAVLRAGGPIDPTDPYYHNQRYQEPRHVQKVTRHPPPRQQVRTTQYREPYYDRRYDRRYYDHRYDRRYYERRSSGAEVLIPAMMMMGYGAYMAGRNRDRDKHYKHYHHRYRH